MVGLAKAFGSGHSRDQGSIPELRGRLEQPDSVMNTLHKELGSQGFSSLPTDVLLIPLRYHNSWFLTIHRQFSKWRLPPFVAK